jgi:hypothetical protein
MSTLTLVDAETVVAGWRSGLQPTADRPSPAGPLFSVEHAEADIAMDDQVMVATGPSWCSASCVFFSHIQVGCC